MYTILFQQPIPIFSLNHTNKYAHSLTMKIFQIITYLKKDEKCEKGERGVVGSWGGLNTKGKQMDLYF